MSNGRMWNERLVLEPSSASPSTLLLLQEDTRTLELSLEINDLVLHLRVPAGPNKQSPFFTGTNYKTDKRRFLFVLPLVMMEDLVRTQELSELLPCVECLHMSSNC